MKKLIYVAAFALSVAACGDLVEVPPAHIGKLSTSAGLSDGVIQPSKFRLDFWGWNTLVTVETSDYAAKETIDIFMPQDQLILTVDVRGIFTVSPDKKNLNAVFSRVLSEKGGHRKVRTISVARVYETYARPIIRESVRTVLTKHTIAQVMEQRATVSKALVEEIQKRLKPTPMMALTLGLADAEPPEVIITARKLAKKKEIEIRQAEAEQQVAIVRAEAKLALAKKDQEIQLTEAETQLRISEKLTEGVNPAFVTQRWLTIMEKMANSHNKVFILSADALKDPAVMMGVKRVVTEGIKAPKKKRK
jgi:regulator of protease activity HflC (stomatin/prohibitin superfamily)